MSPCLVRRDMQSDLAVAFHNVCSLLVIKICVREAEN